MKIECVRGRRAGAERETSRQEVVKYLKINAISNAQSDYIARGWQRCEGSDGFFSSSFLVRIKLFIEKKQAYLHPDEEPFRRHLCPPSTHNPKRVRCNCENLSLLRWICL